MTEKTTYISTKINQNIVITELRGKISVNDVNTWFEEFEPVCQKFIANQQKIKLLVDRRGYEAEHFSVQKIWKEKFFNDSLLKHCSSLAFVFQDDAIMDFLKNTYASERVQFFQDYHEAYEWLSNHDLEPSA